MYMYGPLLACDLCMSCLPACMLHSQTHGLDPKFGPAWMGDSGLEAHTITSDTVPHRSLIGSDCCSWKKLSIPSLVMAMPTLSQLQPFDNRPVLSWTAPAGTSAGTATAAVAWSCELERTPSLAGQLVYFAIKVALPTPTNRSRSSSSSSSSSSLVVGLWVDSGTGVWQKSCGPNNNNNDDDDDHVAATMLGSTQNIHRTAGCLRGSSGDIGGGRANEQNGAWGSWETISFSAKMERSGTARFALHVEGTPPAHAGKGAYVRVMAASSVDGDGAAQRGVDAAAVVVAPVGSPMQMLHGLT
jgi:hypothetical protein